ncbi:MAG: hypothetical protein AB7K52_00130 [Phycisphaerales bacterium]
MSARVRPNPCRRSGVALLDALVAAIVLGLALSAILGLSGQALNSQVAGEQIATAAMLADEQLNLVLARGPDDYAKAFPVEGACDAPFESYRFKLEFAGGAGDAYSVRATIFWIAFNGEQSIMVSTAIAPRPGDDPDPDRRPLEPVERVP